MEPAVRELGRRLIAPTSRRSFLRKASRAVAIIGSGLVMLTATNGMGSTALARAGSCPCAPESGGWCGSCPDPNTNNGCPAGSTYLYSWWCCLSGIAWKCVDCSPLGSPTFSCQYQTQITC